MWLAIKIFVYCILDGNLFENTMLDGQHLAYHGFNPFPPVLNTNTISILTSKKDMSLNFAT